MDVGQKREVLRTYDILKRGAVNRRTLMWYEQRGLLVPDGRDGAGHRTYRPADLLRVQLIRELRAAGLSLTAIRSVLDSRLVRADDDPPSQWIDRLTSVLSQRTEILTEQLAAMQQAEGDLRCAVEWLQQNRDLVAEQLPGLLDDPEVPFVVRALLSQPATPAPAQPRRYMAQRRPARRVLVRTVSSPTW